VCVVTLASRLAPHDAGDAARRAPSKSAAQREPDLPLERLRRPSVGDVHEGRAWLVRKLYSGTEQA